MKYIRDFSESINSDDISGLIEIKDSLTSILKYKFDNDNNAIEEQITWLDNLISRLKTN